MRKPLLNDNLDGIVRRLAARLNRGGLVGKSSEEFIRMMGGRRVACLSKRKEAHLYTFGRYDSAVLFEINGHFVTGHEAAEKLFEAEWEET